MSPVNSGLVLVTGASGFVGTYVVQTLLDEGYTVRAVARSQAKADHIRSLYPGAKFETAIVPDMNEDGAYDEAIQGVDGVLHIASPFDFTEDDSPLSATTVPAVKGVTNLLGAIKRKNPNVKRVVQMSSIASAAAITGGTNVVDETWWNDEAVKAAEELVAKAPPIDKYIASKVLAERAFWDALANDEVAFEGVSVLPGVILGPARNYSETGQPQGSQALILGLLAPGASEDALKADFNIVDVRDVATATVAALRIPEAAGERIILSAHRVLGADIANVGNRHYPEVGLNTGSPAILEDRANGRRFDGSKAQKVLGIQWLPWEETLKDTVLDVMPKLVAAKD